MSQEQYNLILNGESKKYVTGAFLKNKTQIIIDSSIDNFVIFEVTSIGINLSKFYKNKTFFSEDLKQILQDGIQFIPSTLWHFDYKSKGTIIETFNNSIYLGYMINSSIVDNVTSLNDDKLYLFNDFGVYKEFDITDGIYTSSYLNDIVQSYNSNDDRTSWNYFTTNTVYDVEENVINIINQPTFLKAMNKINEYIYICVYSKDGSSFELKENQDYYYNGDLTSVSFDATTELINPLRINKEPTSTNNIFTYINVLTPTFVQTNKKNNGKALLLNGFVTVNFINNDGHYIYSTSQITSNSNLGTKLYYLFSSCCV